ncbi:hypothetical protein [Ekhidna sp. To15]|uniref:hypothetical protein n=1 Tax=Ekhidna sp. To15 TaxID=3395267 RepID=UPI003F5263C8
MEEKSNSFKNLFALVSWVERLAAVTIAIVLVLNYQRIPAGKNLLLMGLAGLAISLFISAYKPRELFSSQEEADEFGEFKFSDILGLIIIPKVLWIASGVSAFGIFAYVADFGNDGYVTIIGAGGFSILISILLLLGTLVIGTKKLNTVGPVLLRATLLATADMYILFV